MTNIRVTVAATAIAKVSSSEVVAGDDDLLDRDRLGDRAEQRQREVEVLAGEVGELGSPGRARRPRGSRAAARAATWSRIAPDLRSPRMSRSPRSGRLNCAALDQQVEVVRGLSARSRCERTRFASVIERLDPVVDQVRLDGIVLVHEHLDGRLLRVEAGERAQLVEQVRRAGSGRRGRRRPRPSPPPRSRESTSTHSTRAQSSSRASPRSMPSSSPPSVHLVGSSGTWFRKATRGFESSPESAKPISTPSDDRVDDQQRDDQRRAAQDLEVLEQQPAHRRQWPRSRRKATKAASKSPAADSATALRAARPRCRRRRPRRRRARAGGCRSARPRRGGGWCR